MDGGVRAIQLTKGYVALVDADLHDWLSQWSWSVQISRGIPYANRGVKIGGRKGKTIGIKMHRAICGAVDGQTVDHINGYSLDNRRANLRICTQAQNTRNRGIGQRSATGFKGVKKLGTKFQARICVDGKMHHLGSYATAEEAARAYDAAIPLRHGAFGRPNFPISEAA